MIVYTWEERIFEEPLNNLLLYLNHENNGQYKLT